CKCLIHVGCVLYISLNLYFLFFFSSRRRHTRSKRDWSSDVCSSDLRASAPRTSVSPTRRRRARAGWPLLLLPAPREAAAVAGWRSEERRVGKECRSRGWREVVRMKERGKCYVGGLEIL